jgi:histone deacetylase 1/2
VNEYYEYFGPDYELDVRSSNTEDMNTPEYLERVKNIVLDNLRRLGGPPSVQMSGMDFESYAEEIVTLITLSDIPKMPIDEAMDDPQQNEDLIPSDTRRHRRLLDSRIQADGELSDSDDEGEGGRRDHTHHRDRGSEPRSHSSEVESAAGRRFGIGVGILSSGAAGSTHGAGPSGHNTVVRPVLSGHLTTEASTPTTTESGPTPIESSVVNGTTDHLSGDKSPTTNGMVVDDENGTSADS